MLNPLSYIEATSAAQAVMASTVAQLRVDGKWGKYTQSVFDGLPARDKIRVANLIDAVAPGETPETLGAYRRSQSGIDLSPKPSSPALVTQAVSKAAEEFDIPLATLSRFVQIESRGNPLAVNGSSRGLMQMQPGAWTDASKIANLRSYSTGVFDPFENARAGAAYIKYNRRILDKIGYKGPWDSAHMYLAHQQGAGGLNSMWQAAQGRKSNLSTANMTGNPPQDRKGVTTNPAEFYKRWVAVVNAK